MSTIYTEKTKKQYIFASCREWHRDLYEKFSANSDDVWFYVSNASELEQAISSTQIKYIFFLHWNWVVPEKIWSKYECVCFHMTDVPYGRGGSPLQNLILAGHTMTQLTALKMVEEMDAGPVYKKAPLSLSGSAEEIYKRAGDVSAEIIEWMISNSPVPNPQEGKPYLFKRRQPEQSKLPDKGDLRKIYDYIRMLDAEGYPHAFLEYGDFVVNFRKADFCDDKIVAEVEIKFKK